MLTSVGPADAKEQWYKKRVNVHLGFEIEFLCRVVNFAFCSYILQVTKSVIRTALDQFAAVKNVKFIPNYLGPSNLPQCALVELDSAKKVKEVRAVIGQYPFMMYGMPRPVRARPAVAEMFDDRPVKPKRKMKCCWLEKNDPNFEVAREQKNLTRKHAAEIAFMHKVHLKEEEAQQAKTLKVHYKKFKLIEGIMTDITALTLTRKYNLAVADE
ncbi:ASI1-immunoprecipitated protein 1-like [Cicer arietinum]|uniref:Uncharacterized protein LOC101508723 n=1 Tax=Cicer arietinum TaxID=3827 RepID=A0A3Q7YDY4_CICAR|nr:uncharacterized protein LOC101508723 [Cicer arietinum]